jgi:hypothetical protein
MPLQQSYFQPLSFQQASPMVSGMEAGSNIAANNSMDMLRNMQAAQTGIQNAYLPSSLAQSLKSQKLANALAQSTLPFAAPQAQANLGLTDAQTGLVQGQTSAIPSQIALQQAQVPFVQSQTALNNASLPFMQYKFMAPYISAIARQNQANASTSNAYANWSKTPQGMAALQKDSGLATGLNSFMQYQANYGNNIANQAGLFDPSTTGNQQAPIQQQSDPTQSPGNQQMVGQSQPSGYQQLPLNQQQVQRLAQLVQPSTNGNIPAIQAASADALTRKITPSPIQNQRYYDQSLNNMLSQVAPVMPDISQFAGLAGHANQTAQKYAQSAGIATSPMYNNYRNFVDVQAPAIANEFRRSLGGQATDSEREAMTNIAQPAYWDKSPQQALNQYNTLVNTIDANSRAISQTPSQNQTSLAQGVQNPPLAGKGGANSKYRDEDIQFTAQKYGMTPSQVRQKLGGQ